MDLSKISNNIPSKKNLELMRNDFNFTNFCHNVILCTEQHYDDKVIERLASLDYKVEYKNSYIDLISRVIKDLLVENKLNRL